MKSLTVILLVQLLAFQVAAQEALPVITFEQTTHDFGTIKEEEGQKKYQFVFTNTGAQPLVVTRVNATCGCTTSDYTRQPVMTGDKGFIEVIYNPAGRPGAFNKDVHVQTNGKNPNVTLTIKGTVTAKQRTVTDDYPRVFGSLRIQNNQLSFLNVKNNEIIEKELSVINTSEQDVTLAFENVPAYVTIESIPKVIPAGEKGIIKAVFDGKKTNDIGFISSRVTATINGERFSNNILIVSAVVKDDFSHLTEEEMANAPKINFTEKVYNFGTVSAGTQVEREFKFTNTGKSPLLIRKVRTGCGCTVSTKPNESIQPGETSLIKVVFNSRGKKGRQAQYIDVYSNDPTQSELKLKIEGNVETETAQK